MHFGVLGSFGVGRVEGFEQFFQSVQSQIFHHRGGDAPLWHPGFCRGEDMLFHESSLQPFPQHGGLHRDIRQ